MSVLKLHLELSSLLVKVIELSVELLNFSLIPSLLDALIGVIELLELSILNGNLILLP